jgi:hypothetical protein
MLNDRTMATSCSFHVLGPCSSLCQMRSHSWLTSLLFLLQTCQTWLQTALDSSQAFLNCSQASQTTQGLLVQFGSAGSLR